MKVLLTGAAGQLGQALQASTPAEISLIATCRNGGDGRIALDLADANACQAVVQEHSPDWVLNAGAYTAVDQAESEPELANAVNAEAPEAFAVALKAIGGRLLQISTDFVFNGAQGWPYQPDQTKTPLNVYGASKADGEDAILRVFKDEARAHILRTSWMMSPVGNNFALTMLRLHRERETFGVVSDQLGCPSSTINLASACWQIIKLASQGNLPTVMHWSDAGAASWYDLSVAVGELGEELGLLNTPALVHPIQTSDYPTPATRPSYSLLDCSGTRKALQLNGEHWRKALKTVLWSNAQQARATH
ncbi:dTDP-4-dehydrorhamnose reductase [Synechococcus sp. MIT S9508]|uniref:dTDP-4-dehydrorhamnose reductase n=1 Tax=Synechococcus sp. MIT S9508 TaxID=1801629 RepID=UPI0007BC24AD|nr:dTDP-4-dehydrorhamnose reductase [Synechococcus sp. MIT S9508]KZR90661.1 dTDP-4-dehydrorhamnose reductase [Synechococcus sp. MIT S9508]